VTSSENKKATLPALGTSGFFDGAAKSPSYGLTALFQDLDRLDVQHPK
jgi:hypothetical protein